MTAVADAVLFVDVRCPSAECRRFILRVPVGTLIEKLYCRGCRQAFANLIAH